MRKDTKSELHMLREIAWLLCPNIRCQFCGEPLFVRKEGMTFGHRRHGRIPLSLTVHHGNHNRADNRDGNLYLSHSSCHDDYHAWHRQHHPEEDSNGQEGKESKGQEEDVKVGDPSRELEGSSPNGGFDDPAQRNPY